MPVSSGSSQYQWISLITECVSLHNHVFSSHGKFYLCEGRWARVNSGSNFLTLPSSYCLGEEGVNSLGSIAPFGDNYCGPFGPIAPFDDMPVYCSTASLPSK